MPPSPAPVIVWLRDDLRLADNPALAAACATHAPLLCVFVMDRESSGIRPPGGASRWWLHHSLTRLAAAITEIGGRLDILSGPAGALLPALARASGAGAVFWNRRYGVAEIAVDEAVKAELAAQGIRTASFNSHLLTEPWEVRTKSGGEFKVFTPFWRACLEERHWPLPLPEPKHLLAAEWPRSAPKSLPLAALNLLPVKPDWSAGLASFWQPGEIGAQARLARFLDQGIDNYGNDRNRPDLPNVSSLSPHLRFGEISPRQIVRSVEAAQAAGLIKPDDAAKFLSEIGWREFSYHLLYHHPNLATVNFSRRFDAFPWAETNAALLQAWQKGQTGYPIVDAGMRQLWQTGFMHNRVRMVTASFLTKHLMIDWRVGENWFWDTLCDADPANNPASWQWVAGSGADAAPYFRIFNPVLQGEKFDPNGDYVRQFVPELDRLPAQYIHEPWDAPPAVLRQAGVRLGSDYPRPVVEHGFARDRALAAFAELGK